MKPVCRAAVATIFLTATALPALGIEQLPRLATVELIGIGVRELEASEGAQRRVAGTVMDIDRAKGLVTMTSPDGLLKLYFPPQLIAGLNRGDRITAHLAFSKTVMSEEGSTRAYDVPKDLIEQRMIGTVQKVDADTGWLHVKTDQATLQLYFPPQALRGLREGDRITVDLGFSKGS